MIIWHRPHPRRKKSAKIGEISPIYRVSAGGDTTNGGDKSAGRYFSKNRQKSAINRRYIGDTGKIADFLIKSPINPVYRRFIGDLSPIFWRFFEKIGPLSPA